ncbi:MAG: hypothetical protein L6Q74_06120 [Sphaerotilus natans subsp. sulfidivorans]|uniref:hypothetical protein n=1 Tax=Sphaerotilus sulfidivorans TaxID=639200 RepID=UPI002353912F|nr:hypothetical protein [Sphaerotilus sulfidivorans]MCK6401467.1 hypothetical protein [Sphaerotilus sulfidivorans]
MLITVPRVLLLTLALLTAVAASAQDGKLSVSVDHSGNDVVGQRLAFAVREAIRSSAGYRLEQPRDALLHLSLITLDPERAPSNTGFWTAAAVSYTMRNGLPYEKGNPQTWYAINLSTSIVIAGTSRVEEQAKSILAVLDKQVDEYRKAMQPK